MRMPGAVTGNRVAVCFDSFAKIVVPFADSALARHTGECRYPANKL
jgi:hypothetical protein